MTQQEDTIVALATPKGRGGIAVVRVSGVQVSFFAEKLLGCLPQPRYAFYGSFYGADDKVLDRGVALYFPGPNSYTGEDVLELQCHGSPFVVQALMDRVVALGGREAGPGEFTQRAFLNQRMDLTEAEAVADLIDARSFQATQSALSSLQGVFRVKVEAIMDSMLALRVQVEGAIDFVEENLDLTRGDRLRDAIGSINDLLSSLIVDAQRGVALQQQHKMVLFGPTNVGKSTLMNYLTQNETSIVTQVPGTTRDVVSASVVLSGHSLEVVDTAGIRLSEDVVEVLGIKKAQEMVRCANFWVAVFEVGKHTLKDLQTMWQSFDLGFLPKERMLVIWNKADQVPGVKEGVCVSDGVTQVTCSLKTGVGVEVIDQVFREKIGGLQGQTPFCARTRHVRALHEAQSQVKEALVLWEQGVYELVAQNLTHAHDLLGEITGKTEVDGLLGAIFSEFCVGK
jgi:tRNA modification GTPase